MQIILASAYCAVFIYFLRKFKFFKTEGIPEWWPTALFLLKVVAGVALGLLYTYHYTDTKTTDTWKFFNDSRIMFGALKEHPYDFFRMITGYDSEAPELRKYYLAMDAWLNKNMLFNDNKTIIRLNAFFHLISLGYYYVHVVLLNCLSFTGLFCLFKVFHRILNSASKELMILTFLFPSVLFWGSGLLKDGLLLFGLGFFIYQFYCLMNEKITFKRVLLFLIGLGLMSITKFYIINLMAPGAAAWWITKKFNLKHGFINALVLYLLFFIAAFNFYLIRPEYDLSAILYWKQFNFYGFANSVDSKSLIEIPRLGFSSWSIIKNVPEAWFTTFFRPFVTDIHGNPLILLAVLENLSMIALLIIAIFTFQKPSFTDSGFFWMSVFFIFTLFALIGLTTPVLGAIVRYKIPALPFLGFVLMNLTRKRMLK